MGEQADASDSARSDALTDIAGDSPTNPISIWDAVTDGLRRRAAVRRSSIPDDAGPESAAVIQLLKAELRQVEESWGMERKSSAALVERLQAKDETIWRLATEGKAGLVLPAPGEVGDEGLPAKPPRLGHRERPLHVPALALRKSGAVVLTPSKQVLARQRMMAKAKPAWDAGHQGGLKYGGLLLKPSQPSYSVHPKKPLQAPPKRKAKGAPVVAPTGGAWKAAPADTTSTKTSDGSVANMSCAPPKGAFKPVLAKKGAGKNRSPNKKGGKADHAVRV